jgi:hypothetical protein
MAAPTATWKADRPDFDDEWRARAEAALDPRTDLEARAQFIKDVRGTLYHGVAGSRTAGFRTGAGRRAAADALARASFLDGLTRARWADEPFDFGFEWRVCAARAMRDESPRFARPARPADVFAATLADSLAEDRWTRRGRRIAETTLRTLAARAPDFQPDATVVIPRGVCRACHEAAVPFGARCVLGDAHYGVRRASWIW